MKTTDLIPIILYQLIDGDKYGYEIVKQIEDSSNGEITIKQPTLYSVLKKLEQGKFITSYWQDSEIGGKRHYYKLTDNGRSQLDTYPPFETLINDVMENEGITLLSPMNIKDNTEQIDKVDAINENVNIVETNNDSVLSQNQDKIEIKPINIDLTLSTEQSNEFTSLFEDKINESTNNILNDNLKPITFDIAEDINYSGINNVEIEKPNTNKEFESTTENKVINIFDAIDYNDEPETQEITTDNKDEEIVNTEPDKIVNNEIKPIIDDNYNKFNDQVSPIPDISVQEDSQPVELENNQLEQVQFLNYIDFKTNKASINRKKSISKHIQKMSLTCISLLITFIIGILLCSKYSFSKLYYISAIIVGLILILYPIVLIVNIPKIKLKYCSKPFKYSVSRNFFIKLSLFLSLIIIIFAYNLSIVTNIKDIFALNNCANFIVPILFSTVIMLDFVYSVILYRKYSK